MSALLNLTYLAVVILLGLFSLWIAKILKMSYILPLLVVGLILGNVHYKGQPLLQFPQLFTTSIALLALVLVVFDSSSRFKYKDFDAFSIRALILTAIFLALNLIFLSNIANILFNINNLYVATIFAALMSGTSPVGILSMVSSKGNKVVKLLEVESILNTTFIVLVPFIIIDLMESVGTAKIVTVVGQIIPFIQQFVTGIGAGLLVGLILFKLLRKSYSETLSPLVVIAGAILTYVLAENLGGNGVLAVTVTGLMFGNLYVKEKKVLLGFSSLFAIFLEILVFVMIGLLIAFPFDFLFLIKSIALYAVFLLIRYASIHVTFRKNEFSVKEKLFMTLVSPKGVAVAAVAATFATFAFPGVEIILNLVLIFILYSIILSTIVLKFSKKFLNTDIAKVTK